MSAGICPGRSGRLSFVVVAPLCLLPLAVAVADRLPGWPILTQAGRIASLEARLRGADPVDRETAADLLSLEGSAGETSLVKSALDDDAEVRLLSLRGLGLMVPRPTRASEVLQANMRDVDVRVRRAAANVLSLVGDRGEIEQAELSRSLEDDDEQVRFYAARSLVWRQEGSGDPAIRVLLELLASPDLSPSIGRINVLEVLQTLNPIAEYRAIDSLVPLLRSRDPICRISAIKCLERMGPRAAPAIPSLRMAVRDEDRLTRSLAALALATIDGGTTEPAIEVLAGLGDRRLDSMEDRPLEELRILAMGMQSIAPPFKRGGVGRDSSGREESLALLSKSSRSEDLIQPHPENGPAAGADRLRDVEP